MISRIIFIALLSVVICRVITEADVTIEFGNFIKLHGKKYENVKETIKRYNIFAENYRYIEEHNSKDNVLKLGVNQFADMTMEEIKAKYLSYKAPTRTPCTVKHTKTDPKEEINWFDLKKAARVKNQGSCGSCWAFSAIGALESLHAIKKDTLVEYSEQELVDCSRKYGDNHGCQGGDMSQAFD